MKRHRVNTGSSGAAGATVFINRGNSMVEKSRAETANPNPKELASSNSLAPSDLDSKNPNSQARTSNTVSTKCEERASSTSKKSPSPLKQSIVNTVDRVDANIYIGDIRCAKDKDLLRSLHITHIINAAKEIPNFHERDMESGKKVYNYLKLGLLDSNDTKDDLLAVLEPTYRYITNVTQHNPKAAVLVHCHMGKSRSASIVIYYLMRRYGWNFTKALALLKLIRPIIEPNPWYKRQLIDADLLLKS